MKVQKKISIGSFLKKGEDYKSGDKIIIGNEGKEVQGEFGMQNVFLAQLSNGQEGQIALNQTSMNNLIDGYGDDTLNWIGKEVKVEGIMQNVQGKMKKVYYFLHPNSTLDEATGQFIIIN